MLSKCFFLSSSSLLFLHYDIGFHLVGTAIPRLVSFLRLYYVRICFCLPELASIFSTIDIRYNDASRSVIIGRRQGSFKGMLKQRKFNIVLITEEKPRAFTFGMPEGVVVDYDGGEVSVPLN